MWSGVDVLVKVSFTTYRGENTFGGHWCLLVHYQDPALVASGEIEGANSRRVRPLVHA